MRSEAGSSQSRSPTINLDLDLKQMTKVLHVDDDAGFLGIVKQCLEVQGNFQVDPALSVEEALEKLKKEEYDAVVSDYQMPRKDGLEFLKELREKGNTIPFIMLTGKGREDVAVRALNLGADNYVSKNGDPEIVYAELMHDIHAAVKRAKGEKALLKSEEKYRSLVSHAGTAITVTDLQGRLTYVNKALTNLLGYSIREMLGRPWIDFLCVEDRSQVQRLFQKIVLSRKEPRNFEFRGVHRDGRVLYLMTKPTRFEVDGEIVGFQAIIVDITERKRAEQELQRFSSAVKMSLDGVVITDLNGRIIEANDAATKFYRVTQKDDWTGKNVLEVVGLGEREFVLERMKEAIENGSTKPHEYVINSKSGNKFAVELTTAAMKDKEGKPYGFVSIVRDVTERRKKEEAIKESEAKYRVLVEHSLQGIAIVQGVPPIFVFANTALARIFGYALDEFVSFSPADLIHPDDRESVSDRFCKNLEGKPSPSRYEFRGIRRDGAVIWLGISAQRIECDGLPAVQTTLIDITERKKAEEALKKNEEHLKLALTSAKAGNWDWDFRTNTINRSDEYHRVFGLEPGSLQSSYGSWLKCVHPQDRDRADKEVSDTIKNKRDLNIEYRIVWPDGTTHWINGKGHVFYDTDGQPLRMIGISVDVTENKERETRLKTLGLIVESSDDAIIGKTLNNTISSWNSGAQRILGYTPEEVISKPVSILVPPELRGEESRIFGRIKRGEHVKHYETILETKDGRKIDVSLTLSTIRDANGAITGTSTIARDLTASKKAEEEILEQKEKAERYLNIVGNIIVALDSHGKITLMNRKGHELLGYKKGEIVGREWFETCLPKENREEVRKVFETCMQGQIGLAERHENPVVTKNGEKRAVSWHNTLLKDDNGRIIGTLSSGEDITERKKAEEALSNSEEKFRGLVEGLNEAIYRMSLPSGKYDYFSPLAKDVFGYSQEEFLNDPFLMRKMIHPDFHHYFEEKWADLIQGKVPMTYEYKIVDPEGKERWIQQSNKGIFDEQKRIVAIEGLCRNITEQKKTEESLRDSEKKLETVNEKLRVVGELTGHDVRNKLSAILGNTFLAKKKLADHPETLENIRDVDSTCNQIVTILDFAKAYEMLGVEELTYVNVEKMVCEAVSLFSDLKGVKVENECNGLAILADSLLRQLFYNLIDNSLKYGGKLTHIRIHSEKTEDGQLKLVYEDDGAGIALDAKPKMFGEGYTTGKGSGHGLYLIKKIAEVYGWTIEETGKPGKGAWFVMTIPNRNPNGKENHRILMQ